jgi:hypothetical protein
MALAFVHEEIWMKEREPITLRDLEMTAKDTKNGLACHGHLKVYWNDITNTFVYWYKTLPINKFIASRYLDVLK